MTRERRRLISDWRVSKWGTVRFGWRWDLLRICMSVILLLEKMQRVAEPLGQLLVPFSTSYLGNKVMYRCAINGNFQKSLSIHVHVASWHRGSISCSFCSSDIHPQLQVYISSSSTSIASGLTSSAPSPPSIPFALILF